MSPQRTSLISPIYPGIRENDGTICIMGTPVSSGNRGVLALGSSLINLCIEASPTSAVALLLGNRDSKSVPFLVLGAFRDIPVINARLSPRARPRDHLALILLGALVFRLVPINLVRHRIAEYFPWIGAIRKAKFVGDIRGGDSFSDIYGFRRFFFGFLMALSVLLVRGSMIQFPQTYGPFKTGLSRWMARFLLRRSSIVFARDKNSQRIAQELIGGSPQVQLSPDVAFALEPKVPKEITFYPIRVNRGPQCEPLTHGTISDGSIVGINVNGLMYSGGYSRSNMFGLKLDYRSFLLELVTTFLQEHSGDIWLIPHTYAASGNVESDPDACRAVFQQIPDSQRHRISIIDGTYNQHEIKGIIGKCSFVVASRMHACIAALSQGVPCVGIAYSSKFAGVFESVGVGSWIIDARTAEPADALCRVRSLYRSRADSRIALLDQVDKARKELREVFKRLCF
jgi:colanic acid/amylovoran biosynthesis protein